MPITGSQRALMPARLGVMRLGASRFGYLNPANLVLLINGVDRTSLLANDSSGKPTVQIQQNYNGTPWTCRFTINPNAVFTPVPDQIVVIGLGTSQNREFGGQILRVTHRRRPGNQSPFFDVECTDFTRLLDRRLVTGEWMNMSASDILASMVLQFAPSFTTYHVVKGLPTIADFVAINERFSQVLRRLVTAMGGGGGFPDPYQDLHLFNTAGEIGPLAPTPPQPLTNSNPTLEIFVHAYDGSQERTQYLVEGKSTTCPAGSPVGATSTTSTASTSADWLVVAGGGGGGDLHGGGGGAGGVLSGTDTVSSGSYAIVVGGGGTGGSGATAGASSSFNGHLATGGGSGGAGGGGNGGGGGSGGGGGGNNSGGGGAGSGGAGAGGQGNNGAVGVDCSGSASPGGGGGGGGAAGSGASGSCGGFGHGGAGGNGVASSITGSTVYYGGGGGGQGDSGSGGGGIGGGGQGGAGGNPSQAGTNGTGGGGGAGGTSGGGSGVVIIRYVTGSISATGGTITTSGGYTIHTFTSNGTFTVSTVTLTAAPTAISDIPVTDITALDSSGGMVRVGTQVVAYGGTSGPATTATGNLPGTTLTANASPTSTSISVASTTAFTSAPGWVKIGDQYIRYASIGAGTLNGIPSLGFGAIVAPITSGATVTYIGSVSFTTPTTFSPPLAVNTPVIQQVTVNSTSAQAALAAIEGGDGIHQDIITDNTMNVAGAQGLGNASLTAFATPLLTAEWSTRDMNARPATPQVINKPAPDPISATVIITQATLTIERGIGRPPLRKCVGSTVRLPQIIDVVATTKK